MRIMAIRGKNLTSLAGEFEVDFQAEPLASTGLFAITGATGAGKSTLLDAICLALYEQTPRLVKTGNRSLELPDVGQETITPQDVRNVLRRGAADGYAEVDFKGNDGILYRARWSVRRAGGKAAGRLQKTDMSLARIADGQRLGGTNSEIKKEIEQKIGLGFEQFTRAVILAQNEFAAFLKADENQRGELLETLTGTDIYSDISKRAFERAKAEQAALQELATRMADQMPMEAEARVELESKADAAGAALHELERARMALESQLRWFEAWEKAKREEEAAETFCANAMLEQEASAPRRAVLQQVEAAQAARPLFAEHERLARETRSAEENIRKSEAELAAADEKRRAAAEELERARLALQQAEHSQNAAAPDLDRAKALDAEINALLPVREAARERHNTAAQVLARAEGNARLKRDDHENALRLEALAKTWLKDNAALEVLAEGWQRFDVFLTEACEAELQRRQTAVRLREADGIERQRQAEEEDAAAKLDASAARLSRATEGRDESAALQAGFDIDRLSRDKHAAEQQRERIAQAHASWTGLWSTRLRKEQLEAEAARLADDIRRARANRESIALEQATLAAVLAQAERSLKTAQAACADSVESLRAALHDNEPCPVCGATAHPYRLEDPRLHALLAGLETDVDSHRRKTLELAQANAHMATLAEAGQKQLDACATGLQSLEAELLARQREWSVLPLPDGLDGAAEEDRAAWLANLLQGMQEQLQTIDRQESLWKEAVAHADNARAAYDAAAQAHASIAAAVEAARKTRAEARAGRDLLAEKLRAAEAAVERALAETDRAFADSGWRASWHAAPQEFHEQCRRDAAQWKTHCASVQELEQRLAASGIELTALAEELNKARAGADQSSRALHDISATFAGKQAQRAALFAGMPVADVERMLRDAVLAARERHDVQSVTHQRVVETHSSAGAALNQANLNLRTRRAERDTAAQALECWIMEYNARHGAAVATEELKELLERGADWIAQQRKLLQQIDATVQEAAVILKERQTRRQQHEEQRPTPDDADTVGQQLRTLGLRKEQAQAEFAALQLDLARDEERRNRFAALSQELERQRAQARTWAQLSDLIGSADGKKFRNYAQQFTLDVLLGYANRHLSVLSRRYRLERIGALSLVAVDQDMAGEVRSVHSLSGGESFLLSLALALALASLSSNRVQVESLFIDEGFGSLDSDTLRVAMDALDSLQSQGRKVGVISHVQEMTERISTQIRITRNSGGHSRLQVMLV